MSAPSSSSKEALESELKEWSNGNEQAFIYWKNELGSPPLFITDSKTLHEYAKQEQIFTTLLASVSIGLRAKLYSWFIKNYGSGKFFWYFIVECIHFIF
jgi:hypothetical protein